MGEDRDIFDGVVTYIDGQPFEGLTDATLELEAVNPDDLPEAPELPELTLKALVLTPEQVEAIKKAYKHTIRCVNEIGESLAKWAREVIGDLAATFATFSRESVETLLYYANDNPRWWHLYKHAKKARTRKKYRRLLMKQLLRNLSDAEKKKEART